ncbi:MAG: ERCC4 domain-containing protein [Thermofilum sp.]
MAAVVRVDDRERKAPVLPELIRLGLKLQIERLEVADYVVGNVYGIERKTVDDFANSIIDKRLFEQARLLREAYEKPLIVVEGDLEEVAATRGVSINQLLGALLALTEMKVPVLQVSDPQRTALLIYLLSRRLEKDSSYVPPAKRRALRKGRASVQDVQLNLVSSLPGISYATARQILTFFRTPRKFFQATPAELRKAGLGPKKVSRILEILDTDFTGALDSFLGGAGEEERESEERDKSSGSL